MATTNTVRCDNCEAVAPADYIPTSHVDRTPNTWLHIRDHGEDRGIDVCGWSCLMALGVWECGEPGGVLETLAAVVSAGASS